MLLQQLRDFEWLNEPMAVFFIDKGMKVVSSPETNFWQNKHISLSKDNGHFFFVEKDSDFTMALKWDVETRPVDAECGILVRIDSENWAKCFSIWDKDGKNNICTSVTNLGYSDLAKQELNYNDTNILYKLEKTGNKLIFSFSKGGDIFFKIREFSFINNKDSLKIGAYICNPNNCGFDAIISKIDIS